jgi:YfiR/HmsC-like
MWRVVAIAALATPLTVLAVSRAAESDEVPAEIQAELLAKLAAYDRNFGARAGDAVRVLIVAKLDRTKSQLSAAEMKSALANIDRIGGLPHQEIVVSYEGADALAHRCRSERIAAIYLTPGFEDDIEQIRASLSTVSVLSLGAVADYVPRGVVLGFELESGKPKILLNLGQARLQNVNFPADLLRLMKVYR